MTTFYVCLSKLIKIDLNLQKLAKKNPKIANRAPLQKGEYSRKKALFHYFKRTKTIPQNKTRKSYNSIWVKVNVTHNKGTFDFPWGHFSNKNKVCAEFGKNLS